jgi:hypothetical protein
LAFAKTKVRKMKKDLSFLPYKVSTFPFKASDYFTYVFPEFLSFLAVLTAFFSDSSSFFVEDKVIQFL